MRVLDGYRVDVTPQGVVVLERDDGTTVFILTPGRARSLATKLRKMADEADRRVNAYRRTG